MISSTLTMIFLNFEVSNPLGFLEVSLGKLRNFRTISLNYFFRIKKTWKNQNFLIRFFCKSISVYESDVSKRFPLDSSSFCIRKTKDKKFGTDFQLFWLTLDLTTMCPLLFQIIEGTKDYHINREAISRIRRYLGAN